MPNTVRRIGGGAFEGCAALGSVKISENCEMIGASAFAFCFNLRDVTIPDSVVLVEFCAFASCFSLEGVKLSEDAMFFLNPVTAESNWIVRSREYLYSIGGHDFYK